MHITAEENRDLPRFTAHERLARHKTTRKGKSSVSVPTGRNSAYGSRRFTIGMGASSAVAVDPIGSLVADQTYGFATPSHLVSS